MDTVLRDAVRCRLEADVPGTFLSGGIDSTVLVTAVAQQVAGQKVKVFP